MKLDKQIEELFKYLDQSRHQPDFRLEPQVAPFFASSLPKILRKKMGVSICETIIPEFPIRKGSLKGEDPKDNASYWVDYVAFSKDGSEVFLVELKTDQNSFDDKHGEKQRKTYKKVKCENFHNLIEGVKILAKNPNNDKQTRNKYIHLLAHIARSPYKPNSDKLKSVIKVAYLKKGFRKNSLREEINTLDFPLGDPKTKPKVVYILPKTPDVDIDSFEYINFKEVGNTLSSRGNELERTFAKYLKKWQDSPGCHEPQ